MAVTRVYYTDNALMIDTVPTPFVAGTLRATPAGERIEIRRVGSDYVFAAPFWHEVAREGGGAFDSATTALAYLDAEFAKRRPVGDQHAIPVAIAEAGQTLIPIPDPPLMLSTVRLEVNGIVYRPPEIGVSDVAVRWLLDAFALDPSDRVTLVYS